MHRALALFALASFGCADGQRPEVRVVALDELGPMEVPPGIVGRDGGDSGRFADRSVWVYGDTVVTTAGSYPTTWRNNTMSYTTDLDASDGLTGFVQPVDAEGAPREFFPRTADEAAFDAAHVDRGDGHCADPCGARWAIWGSGPVGDGARALLSYGKIYAEPGEFNFRVVGTSFAIWDDFDAGPTRPEVEADLDDRTLLFDAEAEGEFGVGTNIEGDSIYTFACAGGGHDDGACRLARAPLDRVLVRDAWEFRTDDGWSADVGDAAVVLHGTPNMSVAWLEPFERWIALYMVWDEVHIRTAAAIEGPWSEPETIYTRPGSGSPHGHLHGELAEDGGRVQYVSVLGDVFSLLRLELAPR